MKNGFIITAIAAAVFFASCSTEEEFDGPSLTDLYGQFSVVEGLSVSNEDVDFSIGEDTHFTAQFSKNIEWTLRITGLESGAKKILTGVTNQLDISNSTWNGTTSVLPMFRIEECAVELSFVNEADTLRDTLQVSGTRIIDGLLLSDFEDGTNSDWVTFVQSGADMTFNVLSTDPAAQGSMYFDIGGVVDWDWLIGLIHMPAEAYGAPTYDLSANPENEFFNVMLYKPEELDNGLMLFQFREDDNGDGVYSENVEDMFSFEIAMTEDGWKQYSSKYADLPTLINGQPAAAIGNGVYEPHKLKQVSMLFLANPASGYAHAYLDYLTFTHGGPLVP